MTDAEDPAATAAAEKVEARHHFFLPRKFTDPFNRSSTVDYDAHDLFVIKTEDALENIVTALHDYRVLQPMRMTDPNGNRSEVRFDALGMVAGTAVMGKAAEPVEGDSFDTFAVDLTPKQPRAIELTSTFIEIGRGSQRRSQSLREQSSATKINAEGEEKL